MSVAVGRGEFADDLSRLRVGEEKIDVEDRARGEERDVLAVRTVSRTDVEIAACSRLAADERRTGLRRTVGHDGRIHLVRRFLPVGEELLGRHAQRAVERGLGAGQAGREEVADDRVIAEASADVRQQRLSVAVGEVVRIALELPQRRQPVVHLGIANPHRRQRIDAAFREVLGHAFHDPQRHHLQIETAPVAGDARGNVELEHVHHFVADDVIVLGVVAGQRQDHAIHERIGESARPFADHFRRGGGLLEVGGVRVESDRLARERVVERARKARVPALGLASDVVHHVRFTVVVINVEVLGLEDLEVEVLPLHLVAAEVLCVQGCGSEEKKEESDCEFAHRKYLSVENSDSALQARLQNLCPGRQAILLLTACPAVSKR